MHMWLKGGGRLDP